MNAFRSLVCLFVLIAHGLTWGQGADRAGASRFWMEQSTRREIEATFVRIKGKNVHLKLPNGKSAKTKLDSLTLKDQLAAYDLEKQRLVNVNESLSTQESRRLENLRLLVNLETVFPEFRRTNQLPPQASAPIHLYSYSVDDESFVVGLFSDNHCRAWSLADGKKTQDIDLQCDLSKSKVWFSPSLFASVHRLFIFDPAGAKILVWDLHSYEQVAKFPMPTPPKALKYSEIRDSFWTVDDELKIRSFNLKKQESNNEVAINVQRKVKPRIMRFDNTSDNLAVVMENGSVLRADLVGGKPEWIGIPQGLEINAVYFWNKELPMVVTDDGDMYIQRTTKGRYFTGTQIRLPSSESQFGRTGSSSDDQAFVSFADMEGHVTTAVLGGEPLVWRQKLDSMAKPMHVTLLSIVGIDKKGRISVWQKDDEAPSHSMQELWEQFADQLGKWLKEKNYGQLAALEAMLLKDSSSIHIRPLSSKLSSFYRALAGVGPEDNRELLEEWIKEGSKKSHIPHVALAELHVRIAWEARGGGSALTVEKDAWKAFERENEAARQHLELALEIERSNPEIYTSMLSIGTSLGWDKQQMNALVSKLAKVAPWYKSGYYSMANRLLPRWGGAPGETEQFLQSLNATLGPKLGQEMYARVVAELSLLCHQTTVFQQFGFDYEKTMEGLAQLASRHEPNYNFYSQVALKFATDYNDFARAAFWRDDCLLHTNFRDTAVFPSVISLSRIRAIVDQRRSFITEHSRFVPGLAPHFGEKANSVLAFDYTNGTKIVQYDLPSCIMTGVETPPLPVTSYIAAIDTETEVTCLGVRNGGKHSLIQFRPNVDEPIINEMPSKVRWLYIIPGSGNILVRCNKDIKVLDKSGSELASTESESNHGCLLSPSGKYLFSSPIWGDLLKTQDLKSAGIKKDRSVRILTRCFHPRHDDLYTIYRTRKGDRKAWIEKTNELGETVSKVPLSALSKDRFPSGRSAISPDEKWIVFSGPHPTVYDLSTGEWKCDLMDRPSGTKRFIFSDDGRWLISEGDAENAVFDFANLISTEEEN